MSKYVEFPLEGGGTIVIEAAGEPSRTASGFLHSGPGEAPGERPEPAQASFDQSVEAVRRSADLLVNKLRGLSAPPDEMEICFALKAAAEIGGLTVSKSGNEANFMVTLKWRRTDQEPERERRKSGKREAHPAGPVEARGRNVPGAPGQAPEVHEPEEDDDDE